MHWLINKISNKKRTINPKCKMPKFWRWKIANHSHEKTIDFSDLSPSKKKPDLNTTNLISYKKCLGNFLERKKEQIKWLGEELAASILSLKKNSRKPREKNRGKNYSFQREKTRKEIFQREKTRKQNDLVKSSPDWSLPCRRPSSPKSQPVPDL